MMAVCAVFVRVFTLSLGAYHTHTRLKQTKRGHEAARTKNERLANVSINVRMCGIECTHTHTFTQRVPAKYSTRIHVVLLLLLPLLFEIAVTLAMCVCVQKHTHTMRAYIINTHLSTCTRIKMVKGSHKIVGTPAVVHAVCSTQTHPHTHTFN